MVAGVGGILLSKLNSGLGICSGASAVLGIANFIVLKMQSQEQDNTTEEHLEEQNHSSKKNEKSPKILRTIIITIAVTAIVSVVICGLMDSVKKEDSISESSSQDNYNNSGYSNNSTTELEGVELEEAGCYERLNYIETFPATSNDTLYIRYVGIVHNYSVNQCAEFPKVTATVKNRDGIVIATGEATKSKVMPGESVPIVGEISVDRSNIDEETMIYYQVSCSRYSECDKSVQTNNFETLNIAEIKSKGLNAVTGEVKNNSTTSYGYLELVLIMRKNGKIVYVNTSTLRNLGGNQTNAFEFDSYSDWPEHDSMEVVVNSFI